MKAKRTATEKQEDKTIKVGVGVLIFNDKNQLLLGLRKSTHGGGSWCPPGGHLEYGESFEAAGVRETREETGLEIEPKRLEIAGVTNDFFAELGKHYVTVVLNAGVVNGRPQVTEPEKCETWQWFNLSELPENLFLPMRNFLSEQRAKMPFRV